MQNVPIAVKLTRIRMKRLVWNFFLMGVMSVTIFTFLYSGQEKTVVPVQGNKVGMQLIDEQQIPEVDSNITPIICDEDDKEVCEYIEQQYKESSLKIWFYDLGIILFLKLIELKECLDKCKGTLDAWAKKLICSAKKTSSN